MSPLPRSKMSRPIEDQYESIHFRPFEQQDGSGYFGPEEEQGGSTHFRPDSWKVAWEAAQDVPAPSCEVKAAAVRLFRAQTVQQALGWVLLTQIGLLLGSFGQIMSVAVCLLSFAIFMAEAAVKYVRSWTHRRFFMDVPCAFVPIHQEAHDSLKVFGRYLMSATLLELLFYVPFVYETVDFSRQYFIAQNFCNANENGPGCPQIGTNLLVYLLIICGVTAIVHWVTSLLTVLAFYLATGRGIVALIREKETKRYDNNKEEVNWRKTVAHSCNCSDSKCKAKKRLSISRNHYDRVLCLTWWVHMARHRHLSAMVASAQRGNCGLPGHWFESVAQIKEIVHECLLIGAEDHVLNSTGPLWVPQEMGLRALVSLAKQRREEISKEILRNKGFDLLVQVVREGQGSTSRGLAAAAIAVLATQHKDILRNADVDLSVAVIPLRKLVTHKEYELKEVALGALLNTALTDDEEQFQKVFKQLHRSDGFEGASHGSSTFITTIMDLVHPIAIRLLTRLAVDSPQAREALMGSSGHDGIRLLIDLLKNGMTIEIKASAAGALSELAFKQGRTIGRGPYGESCVVALIEQLPHEPRTAHASIKALCNLGIKWEGFKPKIVAAGGIECFVKLLMNRKQQLHENRLQTQKMEPLPVRSSNSRFETQEKVRAQAARALWMLAYNDRGNQERIAEAKAIPLLVELLLNNRQSVYMQAVAALSALAWKNQKNQELIGQQGSKIFNRIVRLLADLEGPKIVEGKLESNLNDIIKMDEMVLEKVALAISSFADGNKSNREDLRNAGALGRLENIAQNDTIYDSRILRRVKQALDSLKEDFVEPD